MQRLQSRLLQALARSVATSGHSLGSTPAASSAAAAAAGNVTAVSQQGHQLLSTTALQLQSIRCLSSTAAAQQSGPVVAACILERLPLVIQPDPEWEVEYREWSEMLQDRNRKVYTGEFEELRKAGDVASEPEDYTKYNDEIEAAENGDWRSPWRRLDQRLFLLVQPSKGGGWAFPSAEHAAGETIRATAERALAAALEQPGPKVHFMGNGPAGHLGSTFFHRVQLIKGDVALDGAKYADYALAAKDELGQFFRDEDGKGELVALLQKML